MRKETETEGQRMSAGGRMDNEYNSPVMPLLWINGGRMGGVREE